MHALILLFALASEQLDGLETVHGTLPAGKARTILTRPAGTTGRLPAIMLVPWLSCDGIALTGGPLDGMNELSRRIATQSGRVYFRVEKPQPCAGLDFRTELAAYREGFAALRAHPWVDPSDIVLIGMSNGGAILPLVAPDAAGYIVVGGWSGTWYEHMLEHLRRNLELRGRPPGEVSARMNQYAELYADYLLGRKLPGDVVKAKPHLAAAWNDEPARQYGRPAAFFHQLQELNVDEAWSRVAAPTLAVWGEWDWIMGRDDHERIVASVNANKPGAARLVAVPRMTHFVAVHPSLADALADRNGRFPDEVFTVVREFLR